MKAIQTTGLTKYYGKTRGIDGLDLSVEQGDFFGFIGPNGAGKSTTIHILLGLISPLRVRDTFWGKTSRKEQQFCAAPVTCPPKQCYTAT